MLYTWSSQEVPQPLLHDAVVNVINRQVCACDCYIDGESPASSRPMQLAKLALGPVSLVRFEGAGRQRINRGRAHVDDEHADELLLYVPISADYEVDQLGHRVLLRPGHAAVVRLGQPLNATFTASGIQGGAAVHLTLSTAELLRRVPRMEDGLYRPFDTRSGPGRILMSLLSTAFEEARSVRSDAARSALSEGLVDIVAALFHELLDREDSPRIARRPHPRTLALARITSAIDAHLTNTELSPAFLARRCRISVRSLHLAFEGTEWTVSGLIKEQRLQRCRADLRAPQMAHVSVSEVAYRWGFKDLAHFNRSYKARFGNPPGRDRIIDQDETATPPAHLQ